MIEDLILEAENIECLKTIDIELFKKKSRNTQSSSL
jgi:hypothetical protein